jgi:hypothetical protein
MWYMIWWWENTNIDEIIRKIFYKVNLNHVVSSFLDKICVRGPKLSNFKIRGLILQNDKNREIKSAIKP